MGPKSSHHKGHDKANAKRKDKGAGGTHRLGYGTQQRRQRHETYLRAGERGLPEGF